MIETSQLQTLVAVAKANSFSKAAENLHVTQSAISQSIKNLEKRISVSLFKRSGKKVVLTMEGERLYNLAINFLDNLSSTLDEIKHDKDAMSGRVRIGTLTGVGKSWLAPQLLKFAKEHPSITTAVTMGVASDLVSQFENGRLDFLILPEESLPSVGQKIFLFEEKLTLVYPKNDIYNFSESITLDELVKYPTILFGNEDHLFNKWCYTRYKSRPKNINARYIINSHGNMLQAVQQGLGLAVVPNHVLLRSYYRDKVNLLTNSTDVVNAKFYIVFHKSSSELLRLKESLAYLTDKKNAFTGFNA